jgi:hypothetical protein
MKCLVEFTSEAIISGIILCLEMWFSYIFSQPFSSLFILLIESFTEQSVLNFDVRKISFFLLWIVLIGIMSKKYSFLSFKH